MQEPGNQYPDNQYPGNQNSGNQYPYGGPSNPTGGQNPYNPYNQYNPQNPYNPQYTYNTNNPYMAPQYTPPQVFGGPVTQDERSMAMLAHLLQLFSGFIGPLIIYLVKKNQSKFVEYHALQALLWQLCFTATMIIGGILMFAEIIATAPTHGSQTPGGFPIFFVLFWLAIISGWVLNWVLGIYYTIKAYQGEWVAYPLIGSWIRRFM